ncbi:MAG TPA: hypothetical protein VFU88_07275 [Ktedonobacterales bacterium]|jgi:hypothetical protein|nr:hypothetical protein [Ktedonobacterales bacterium]
MPTDIEDDDLDINGEEFDAQEYDTMLRLERLESLEEEMQELGVTSLDDVRRQIAELHSELDEE